MSQNNFLWKFIFRRSDDLEILKKNLIFSDLSARDIRSLMDYLHKRHYQRGEEIIRYGEPGFALYIIKEGEVSVEIPAETGTIEVDTLSVGEFFGEMALVTESPRTATIKCKTDVIIYALTRSAFEELMKVHPNIAVKILYNIAAVLAERLKKLNEQLQKNL